MKCDDCKYAEWKRTSNGRLHPDKTGVCVLRKVVKIPQCLAGSHDHRGTGDEIVIKGRYIERGITFDRCAYYGPNKG